MKQPVALELANPSVLCPVVSGKLDGGDAAVALSEQKVIVRLNNLGAEEGVNRADLDSGRYGSVHLNEFGFDMTHRSIGERNAKEHFTVRDFLGEHTGSHARGFPCAGAGNLYPHEAAFCSAMSPTIGESRKSNAS